MTQPFYSDAKKGEGEVRLYGDRQRFAVPRGWRVSMVDRIVNFINNEIWNFQLHELGPAKAFLIKTLRIVILAIHGFKKDDCPRRASALTYYSLLSFVPILAMIFGIPKGFGLEKYIESQIMELARKGNLQADVVTRIMNFAGSLLEHTKGGVIAGIGVIFLFWTVISILGNVEKAFNDIWEVKKSSTLVRKFTDYISMTVSAPMLVIVSSSITVLVAGEVQLLVRKVAVLGVFSPLIFFLLTLLPYVSISILLTLHYIVMPNTRVPVRSGILAGIVTGTGYQIVQWIYIKFQIGVSSYGAIYGSFAAFPLFLGWLQISWMIVLLGAEIAFAHVNVDTFGFHPDYSQLSISSKKGLALNIFHLITKTFARGEPPLSGHQISSTLKIPVRLVRQLLHELAIAGLVMETARHVNHEVTFQPGRSIENITVKFALDAYEHGGRAPMGAGASKDAESVQAALQKLSDVVEKAPANVILKEIG
jgi:membrane protein